MPFRAPFGTDVYVRNRLRIADSISVLAGTDSFLGTADLRLRDRFRSLEISSKFPDSETDEISMMSGRCSAIADFTDNNLCRMQYVISLISMIISSIYYILKYFND